MLTLLAGRRTKRKSVLLQLLTDRVVAIVLTLYAIFGIAVIGFEELYNLWCLTKVSRHAPFSLWCAPTMLTAFGQPSSGGLGFTSRDIGISLSSMGAAILIVSIVIFPVMEQRFGSMRTFVYCCNVVILLTVTLPEIQLLHDRTECVVLCASGSTATADDDCVQVECTRQLGRVGCSAYIWLLDEALCQLLLHGDCAHHQQFRDAVRTRQHGDGWQRCG
jgi:hypothetical protein